MSRGAWVVLLLVGCAAAVRDSFQWFRTREDCVEVSTESGLVRGCKHSEKDYVAFLGLPYAAPPTGPLRFREPLPPYQWRGIYEADHIVKCPQNGDGVEDCLVVNVFIPLKNLYDEPLPVLVYFHGGSYLMGSGQVKGVEELVKQNLIVVTVNYRLGALGFLCLGVEEAPGNAGLKDQLAALQWIQRNIISFGGDPNRVTIYGMSAGGASVELLVLSPRSKGLFQQAIVESGSATSVWATDYKPLYTALKVGQKLNFPKFKNDKNLKTIVASYYKTVRASKLSSVNFDYYNSLTDGTFGFVPCIENGSNPSAAFMLESPYKILTREKYDKVPMMFFFASLEGLFLRSEEYYTLNYKDRMLANFLNFLPGNLAFDSEEIRKSISENIVEFYFGNQTRDIEKYLNYFGDYLILHSLLNSVEIHSRGDNPVYLMEFAYKGNLGSYDKFYDQINTAGHGDVIKHAILNKEAKTKRDKKAVARVSKLIANFVRFGNPTPERTDLLPLLWPRVYPGNVSCLYMNEEFKVVDEPHWDAKQFWDGIYSKFRKELHSRNVTQKFSDYLQ